jgi:hypothetical protein
MIIACRHEQLVSDGRIHTTHCHSEMPINRKPHLIGVGVIMAVIVTISVDVCVPQLAGGFFLRATRS